MNLPNPLPSRTAILATEATLSTLQVEIKAIVVSGKQMTLAVFRQLPVMDPIGRDCQPHAGVKYWGLVRYSIKDEGDLWAVKEYGGTLFRGAIFHRFAEGPRRCGYNYYGPLPQEIVGAWNTQISEAFMVPAEYGIFQIWPPSPKG